MRKILLLLPLWCLAGTANAQKRGTVRGVAFDTLGKHPVADATITLLDPRDSSLVSFRMTDGQGRFELTDLADGRYRLLVTHVNFHNVVREVKVGPGQRNIDLGNIDMSDQSIVLNEVVVNAESPPVTLLGDTIQYNAGSFKTQPNASVEDLLRRLPGVSVGKDGTVKAQGETVKKVLVDGKEFFGDDPKLATKNLPADAIDKVQVYNKLSDQAELTGFDDGNSEKTINLKLKQDKKKGLFGKLTAGAGTDGRYEGRMNLNSFKGGRQLSVLGTANNTNSDAFSFMDILNFSGALTQLNSGSGKIDVNISKDDGPGGGLGGNTGSGINSILGTGINYNNIIGRKTDFRSSYFFSQFNPTSVTDTRRQYILPANLYASHDYSNNLNYNHRLNLHGDIQLDSFHSIKISPVLNYQQTSDALSSSYSTTGPGGNPVNSGRSDYRDDASGYNFNTGILYRQRMHKRGRTFSLNMVTNLNQHTGTGSLNSATQFFDSTGARAPVANVNQINNNQANLQGFNARAVYTEPLFRRNILEFSAGRSVTTSHSDKTTYDYDTSSRKYDLADGPLSDHYQNTYAFTNGGIRFLKKQARYSLAAGMSWQQASLQGNINAGSKDSELVRTFRNLLPTARMQYNISQFKFISLSYLTGTNQPSISQLQPVPDNRNPLLIRQGNPALKREYTHNILLNASIVNPFRNLNLFAFFNFQKTNNKIVDDDRINAAGVDSVLPVNVNGVYNLNGNLSFGFPVHFLKGIMNIGSDVNFYNGKQFINAQSNRITTKVLSPRVRLDINPASRLNVTLGATVGFNNARYSIASSQNYAYINQDYTASADLQLPRKFYLSTDFDYIINGLPVQGFNARVPLWNASISKQFLRFNRGEIKFSVRDLLDRNIGITRTASQNYIEDSRVNTLRRFFMLGFTFSLSKVGLNPGGPGDIRIISK